MIDRRTGSRGPWKPNPTQYALSMAAEARAESMQREWFIRDQRLAGLGRGA